ALAVKKAGIDPQNDKSLASLCKSLNIRFDAAQASPRIFLNGEDVSEHIRTPEIDMLASKISAIAVVRQEMTRLQRAVAEKAGRAVAEGRDMGTVVFPDAKCKFFLTATLEERARRRYEERRQRGEKVDPAQVARELKKRDEQDEKRALAPLKPAEDAVIIDTTQLTIDEVVDKICGMAKPRFAQTQK
ncbi:MAG: (d)CMP kinase, partial [Deltaproteobacteria bacterium]